MLFRSPSSSAITLNLELTGMDGTALSFTGSVSIPAQGQIVTVLNQVEGFSSLPNSFQGILRVSTSTSPGVSMVGIRARYNERSPAPDYILATVPAMNETAAPSTADLVIPNIADSGGYTTQFVLLSGSTAASNGTLRLLDRLGNSLSLTR